MHPVFEVRWMTFAASLHFSLNFISCYSPPPTAYILKRESLETFALLNVLTATLGCLPATHILILVS